MADEGPVKYGFEVAMSEQQLRDLRFVLAFAVGEVGPPVEVPWWWRVRERLWHLWWMRPRVHLGPCDHEDCS